MKWKRVKPGHYSSGQYQIVGEGSAWGCFHGPDEDPVGALYATKKEAQQAAESHLEAQQGSEPTPAPVAPVTEGKPEATTLEELRVNMSSLHTEIVRLNAAVNKLTEMLEVE